ncbi:MAG: ABC transporter ATP-binding protein [Clostridia bacterium]|nr:ABC transporter ATP-binding protein [Clostridia bacterium]MDD6041899.1 ABC transporter ATP-binding protein [Clostridia bacterium]
MSEIMNNVSSASLEKVFEARARQVLSTEPILSARDVEVQFTLRGQKLNAIRRCSLDLYDGETLAIVGESGSGKSVFTKTFVGMLDKNGSITGGSILYDGKDLAKFKTEAEWRTIRGKKIAMVTQDPMTSLNPLKKIGQQIREAIELNQNLHGRQAKAEAIRLLELVGIQDAERRYNQYPHEFSGGMRQRVVIAIAVACNPQILICDEPTTALDVTIQAQILELIRKLQREKNMTIIYITHDLGVVANVADRVAVMYAGQIIEIGMANEIFFHPSHPYTWALLSAMPQLGVKGEKLPAIDGTPPNLFNKIMGDSFAPRNRRALNIDFIEEPPMFDVTPTHQAKTWMLDQRAPKVEQPIDVAKLSRRMNEAQPSTGDITHPHQSPDREPLVEVKDLQITFGSGRKKFVAVDDVNFTIYKGETFSLVGESGSGKTTIGRALVRINPTTNGEILYRGQRVNGKISREQDENIIRKCQMIFQDPMASLNERAKVDYIVSEGLYNFHLYENEQDRQNKVKKALEEVGLLPEFSSRFPHEFSGGQRQRIGIARSLIMQPEFIVADEPISALDVSIRAQVLNLLNDLKKERGLTYLFIAHDLSVVRFISDRIAVIHKGRIVELAESEELFRHPLHPYTKALLSAVPNPNPYLEREKKLLVYDPSMHDYSVDKPVWCELAPDHFVYGNERELDQYRAELQ